MANHNIYFIASLGLNNYIYNIFFIEWSVIFWKCKYKLIKESQASIIIEHFLK